MCDKKKLAIAISIDGDGLFTNKKTVMIKFGVKDYSSVNPYFHGLEHWGHTFWAEDVAGKMLELSQ